MSGHLGDDSEPGTLPKRQRVRAHPDLPQYELQVDKHTLSLDGGSVRALITVPLSGSGERPEALTGRIDTMFVVDLSDSMRGTPIQVVGEAIKELYKLDQSHVQHRIAFMTFSTNVHVIADGEVTGYTKWMELTPNSQAMLLNMAARLGKTEQATNIADSIRGWNDELSQRRSNLDEETTVAKNVVYITDGDATSGDITDPRLLGRLVGNKIDESATVVHVLCVGNKINKETGRALCASSGGVWAHAPTPETLVEEFGRILGPLSDSAKPFLVEICDGKGRRVEHKGLLTKSNRTFLTTLTIKDRQTAGMHLAATVGNPCLSGPPASLMMQFAAPGGVPDDQEVPKELKEHLEDEAFLAEMARKVAHSIATQGYDAAADLSRTATLAATESGGVSARGIQRQQAFTAQLLSRADSVATGPRGHQESQLTSDSFAASSQYY